MERKPNEEQLLVIEEVAHNLIVFASAGTGKTFTVANRVGEILSKNLATPAQILLLTFTTKACEEMRADIRQYVGESANHIPIHTIHSFCYRLLREENRLRGDKYLDATVCDEMDSEELLKSILASQYALWKGEDIESFDELPYQPFAIFERKGKLQHFISHLKHVREEQGFYSENEEKDYQKTYTYIQSKQPDLYEKLFTFPSKGGGHVCDH